MIERATPPRPRVFSLHVTRVGALSADSPSIFIFSDILNCVRLILSVACIRGMESVGFFEGPEKLMEVWWQPVLGADRARADLRNISR